MSTKTQMYSELAEKTSKELTHSVNEWCMFLKSQAKLYKYPYADQLMIYAQRPMFRTVRARTFKLFRVKTNILMKSFVSLSMKSMLSH